MMAAGVYQITCLVTGKRYIGSSIDLRLRWRDHKSALVSMRHQNAHLQAAWNKYGADNFGFEVLEQAEPTALKNAEERWLDSENPEFNINPRADAPMRGLKATPEHRAKISRALIGHAVSSETRALLSAVNGGRPSPHRGRKLSEETKAKLSAALKGRQKSPEHRANISKAQTGRPGFFKGRSHSEESKAKMRTKRAARQTCR